MYTIGQKQSAQRTLWGDGSKSGKCNRRHTAVPIPRHVHVFCTTSQNGHTPGEIQMWTPSGSCTVHKAQARRASPSPPQTKRRSDRSALRDTRAAKSEAGASPTPQELLPGCTRRLAASEQSPQCGRLPRGKMQPLADHRRHHQALKLCLLLPWPVSAIREADDPCDDRTIHATSATGPRLQAAHSDSEKLVSDSGGSCCRCPIQASLAAAKA